MRIILNQEEIEAAIEAFILDQVRVPDEDRIDIALKATRGEEGYTAEIDILPYDAPTDGTDRSVDPRIDVVPGAEHLSIGEKVLDAKRQATLPRRRGRPAGAKNLPKGSEGDEGSTESRETEQHQAEQQQEAEPVAAPTEPVAELEPAPEPQEAQQEASEPELAQETLEQEIAPSEAPAEPEQVVEAEGELVLDQIVEEAEPEPEATAEPTQQAEAPEPEPEALVQPEAERVEEPEPVEEVEQPPASPAPTRSLFANLTRTTP